MGVLEAVAAIITKGKIMNILMMDTDQTDFNKLAFFIKFKVTA